MEQIQKDIANLRSVVEIAMRQLRIDEQAKEATDIAREMAKPDFWNDPQAAQAKSRKHAQIENRVGPWTKLKADVDDVAEIAALGDIAYQDELKVRFRDLSERFAAMQQELQLAGPYDDRSALISIHAGAGGTDAQDWAEMLRRMYVRWAERHDFKVHQVDESAGDEAGIKSATLEIEGNFVYGKLKGEHGVHRLVRLSPYNADNLRQTSFAKVEVLPKIEAPELADLDEKDLKIDVYRSGGHGGQSVNTTDSAVRITHLPTGLSVAIQNERSQLQNKEMALTILRSKLIQLQIEQHAENLSSIKGPNEQAAWGNQIRSYVLHPYKQVKDLRTNYTHSDPQAVLDGDIDDFIRSYLEQNISHGQT